VDDRLVTPWYEIFIQPYTSNIKLSFNTAYYLEPGYDYAYIHYSTDGGSNWIQLDQYNGSSGGAPPNPTWVGKTYSLPSTAGTGKYYSIRFWLKSDSSISYQGGFMIDDVKITRN
jgi:hypothetical protein